VTLVDEAVNHLIEHIRDYDTSPETLEVFGFFSFATIGMTDDEIESSIRPLRRTFVRSLCTFLGR
jgi:hypothetical protein